MARRAFRLPRLGGRAFATCAAAVLLACGAAAVAFRASLTDYGADPAALDALPYRVTTEWARSFELCSGEQFAAAVAAEEERGGEKLTELGQMAGFTGLCPENVRDYAPLVVTATFTGERTYVYQAFRCDFEVTSVVSGAEGPSVGVAVGDVICAYENSEIVEPENYTGGAQLTGEREVTRAAARCWVSYREGQEYLLFLEPKAYPEGLGAEPAWCLVEHPYACVPLDACEHPERIWVDQTHDRETGVDADGNPWSQEGADYLTYGEAQAYDRLVYDEEARDAYLAGCARVLATTLG